MKHIALTTASRDAIYAWADGQTIYPEWEVLGAGIGWVRADGCRAIEVGGAQGIITDQTFGADVLGSVWDTLRTIPARRSPIRCNAPIL